LAWLRIAGVTSYLAQLLAAADFRGQGIGGALICEILDRSGDARLDLLTNTTAGLYTAPPHRQYSSFRIYPSSQHR
jgi:GNAT superfamily N-acetyltransferase